MKNIDYIYRNNGESIIHSNINHKINISKLLEDNYPYISDSINKSSFNIRYNECDQFKELIYNKKVVGFVTYNILNKSHKLLTNIYIIEGYRRNRILSEEIKYQYTNSQKISIFEPTKLLIDVLIRLGYAKKITKSLVVSAINFYMQLATSLTNTNEETHEKLKITNMYDTNICATLSFKIFNKKKYTVYYTPIIEEDKNKCEQSRLNLEKNYFDSMVSTIIGQDMEIQRWLFLLYHNLPSKQIDIEELIGTDNSPSEILKENIKNNKLTNKDVKIIQNQLRLELKTNKIDEKTLNLRLNYLINNTEKKKNTKINYQNNCPYCNEAKPSIENYCTNCGYKLFDLDSINEEDYVYKNALQEKQLYKHSLNGKKEPKKYFSQNYLIKCAICEVIQEIYRNSVGKEIFQTVQKDYEIDSKKIENLMLEENYVTFNMNLEKWEKEANNYTKNELKTILKENNQKVSGNKYELIQRIKKEIPLEKIKSKYLRVTHTGEKFLSKHKYMLYFNDKLQDYVFEEFQEFIEENTSENIITDEIAFLEKHVEMAKRTENHDQLTESLKIQSQLYSCSGNLPKILKNEVEIVIINLNMYYIDSHYYKYYKPVEKHSWEMLYDLKDNYLDEEVHEIIEKIYHSLDKKRLRVSYYDMIDVFKDIFKHYSLTGINGRIQRKYYKKEYDRIKDSKKNKITLLDRFFLN